MKIQVMIQVMGQVMGQVMAQVMAQVVEGNLDLDCLIRVVLQHICMAYT